MTRARLAALLLFVLAGCGRVAERGDKPELMLLTSLPIVFSEEFSLDQKGSPLLDELGKSYRVVPIDTADKKTLARAKLLMMAQPRAQAPEDLVALDEWVRGGGRLLLFADPMLEWPNDKPLGDLTRPPVMFADTGLLGHWGLRLDAPNQRGPVIGMIEGKSFTTVSSGTLHGGCAISDARLIARCDIGKGKAVIVADADLLNLSDQGPENGDAVLGLLESLEAE